MTTLYLDMDGVVADFSKYARNVLGHVGSDNRWHYDRWIRLRDNPRLYRDLDPTPEANDLVDFCRLYCKDNGLDLKFLTAIPRGNDMPWAFQDKFDWVQKYFSGIPLMFGPYSKDKAHHCKTGDILIDDRTVNCEEWTAAGGLAIHYTHNLEQVVEILTRRARQ